MRHYPSHAVRALLRTFLLLVGICVLPHGAEAGPTAELLPGVTYEVLSLKRLGDKNIVELRYALTNGGEKDLDLEKIGLAVSPSVTFYASGVRLVDLGNAKTYYPGFADGRCFCSVVGDDSRTLPSGGQREFWSWYAAPGGSVTKLGVFFPGARPVLDVALEK